MEISIRLFRQVDGGRVHDTDETKMDKGELVRVQEKLFISVDGGFTKDEQKKADPVQYLQSEITVDGVEAGGEFPVSEERLSGIDGFSFSDLAHHMAARYISENKIDISGITDLTVNISVGLK